MPQLATYGGWIMSKHTGEKCVICKFPLTKEFPEDFPDEFKFCCTCKEIAWAVIRGTLDVEQRWLYKRVEKIEKIITVMGL